MREYSSPAKAEISDDARLTDTLYARAAGEPSAVAARQQESGQWRDVTVAELHGDIAAYAKALINAGIGHGDRVALLSRTRYEWTVVDYAIWSVGAVTVPIYETSSAEQIEWILSDSAAKAVFVESQAHAERITSVRDKAPELKEIWRFDGPEFAELRDTGSGVSDEDLEERRTAVKADDLATLIYTSGTTGRPKGCQLTHRNFLFIAHSALEGPAKRVLRGRENPSTLLFLPLAHVFARFVQVMVIEAKATLGHYPSTGPDLIEQFSVFKPTFLLAVPRVFEKVYTKAEQKATAEGKGKIFAAAADTAIAYSQALATGRIPLTLKLKHALFAKLVYGKLLAALGGNAEYAVSGGSALGARLGHFFRGIGFTIIEGYGLTETTAPTSVNSPEFNKIGTVGQPMPGTTIRIAEDGEILLKGDHIMVGYWNNEKASQEAFTEDGFYRTGDLGSLDDDGFLSITGRKKEIIVTAGGKNVAPAVLEDRIRAHALVSQCMVVGDNRKFIAALVTIDPESFEQWKAANKKTGGIPELTEDPDLVAAIQEAVDHANQAVSKAEAIKKFKILPSDFTEESGQMTASLKVKRHVVNKEWSKEIEEIYAG
ncbi:AMP-dependent synthetase/ligase [Nocardiopsis changdeensis]|uniref:Acyl-CoA synthetase n=1 Tax=Nocardiopsis changdeensis TaxID=2831969 RepID=A0ABX8BQI6_9ACTN|nr:MULTISPECIES: AMP-dependent synthetase/ligase [Nocardiopsis]QUX24482.1 long-chain fatty acid--CoA ligase [Nocardiopsis changdeensis]QYX34874.1 AMP-dependent synthetase/ligase [Nocardiopsis sp. MT53]